MLLKNVLVQYAALGTAKPLTILQYGWAVSNYAKWLGRKPKTQDLTDVNVAAFRDALKVKGRAATTINARLGALTAIAEFAVKRGCQCAFTHVETLTVPKRVPDSWTPEEVGRIFTSAKQEKGFLGWGGQEWIALLLAFYDTGARRNAMLTRLKSDVIRCTMKTGEECWSINFDPEHQKTATGQILAITDETYAAIQQMRPTESDLLFAVPYKGRSLYHAFTRIVKRAGLSHSRRDKFHKIRRTAATQVAKVHGIEQASLLLGHTTVQQTTRNYIDPTHVMVNTTVGVARPVFSTGWQ